MAAALTGGLLGLGMLQAMRTSGTTQASAAPLRINGGSSRPLSGISRSGLEATPDKSPTPLFGVLNAQEQDLPADTNAGLRLAMVNIGWNLWEPNQGGFSASYMQQQVAKVKSYQRDGWTVAVDVGLQFPPAWALTLPAGDLTSQTGSLSGTADFEFSEPERLAASAYITSVVGALPNIRYYRIGLSQYGELLYPAAPADQWWSFNTTAQGTALGLPPGVTSTPLPGWIPGTPTWNGKDVTPAMVTTWYNWYLGALINAHDWEITSFREAGYSGYLQYVTPGTGAIPYFYNARLANDLAAEAYDPFNTLNTGAVWWRVFAALPHKNAVVDISSVDDGSGSPANNGCTPSDSAVRYRTSPNLIINWSDTRWLTYLAQSNNMPVMGENAGDTSATSLPTVMNLTGSCHLIALQWAFDSDLSSPSSYITLSQYAQAARSFR